MHYSTMLNLPADLEWTESVLTTPLNIKENGNFHLILVDTLKKALLINQSLATL